MRKKSIEEMYGKLELGANTDEKVEFDSKAYYDENVDNQLNKAKEIISSME